MGAYPSGANGFARVDPRVPVAFAICDRCGMRYNRTDLTWQIDWRGAQLQNLRILVCKRKCLDIPQEQLCSYSPPPDPLPVRDPRPDLSNEGVGPTVVTTVACAPGTWRTLIDADATRTIVDFAIPASFGLFINPTGGAAGPGQTGSLFYGPNTAYTAEGDDAIPTITYFTTIAGLTIVVQTQVS